jgi:hypothetical protein
VMQAYEGREPGGRVLHSRTSTVNRVTTGCYENHRSRRGVHDRL